MAKVSVITPTNSVARFQTARKSLIRQSFKDWEWVVLFNGDAQPPGEDEDPRIRLVRSRTNLPFVGALKKEACSYATSPYIVEFDHDDELSSDCLKEVVKAFETTPAVFVYSDDAVVNADGSRREPYGAWYGWSTRNEVFLGEAEEDVVVHNRPVLLPQNVSRILFAPDHVRAWKRDAYEAVGGHDSSLKICDDLDLMQKLYAYSGGKFHHIEKCLYKYVVHGENTWLKNQGEIQVKMMELHDGAIEKMTRAHCANWGLAVADLGGNFPINDLKAIEEAGGKWPLRDGSVGLIVSKGAVEQLAKPIHLMNEAYRVLAHGGLFIIEVPESPSSISFHPANRSQWSPSSFWYYTRKQNQDFIKPLGVDCRFQEVQLSRFYPSDWHKENNLPFVRAHLAAIKDGPILHGGYHI